jgi:hypothetical protein
VVEVVAHQERREDRRIEAEVTAGRVFHGGYPLFRDVASRIEEAVGEGDLPILTRRALRMRRSIPPKYWFYNTEPLHVPAKRAVDYMALLDGAERVLDYSERNLEFYPRAEFRPIALGEVTPPPDPGACDVDVLFYGYLTPRREAIVTALSATRIDRVYGEDLVPWFRRSKVVLCVGSYDDVNNNSLRVFPALERGARLLVEACQEEWFNRIAARYAVVVPYGGLVAAAQEMLEDS